IRRLSSVYSSTTWPCARSNATSAEKLSSSPPGLRYRLWITSIRTGLERSSRESSPGFAEPPKLKQQKATLRQIQKSCDARINQCSWLAADTQRHPRIEQTPVHRRRDNSCGER